MSSSPEHTEFDAEAALQRAIKDVSNGMSQQAAARKHAVPRATLGDRIRGAQDRRTAHEDQQHLTPSEEREIVQWCAEMEKRFLPVHLSHIRAYAEAILRARGPPGVETEIGESWVKRFHKRHPELRVVTSKQIDQKRVMAKDPTKIMNFYVMLSNIYDKYKIPPERRSNCDEKGYQIGVAGNEKVFIMRRDPGEPRDGYAGGSKQSGSRETVTTIDAVSAQGALLPPFIIMKGKNIQRRWSENSPLPPTTRWAASPNGWTDDELGVEYIMAFDGWTEELSVNGQWQCLILDGHRSHLTYEFLKYATDNRIIVVGLLSHTTDFLQPLDRGLFRPLQNAYSKEVNRRIRLGEVVTEDTFASVLHRAREEAYTEQNIRNAFKSTGISPLDPWHTRPMAEFRAKMQANGEQASPAAQRQRAQIHYLDLVNNPAASTAELREALSEAMRGLEGAEARIAILELELKSTRELAKERQRRKAPGGRVGEARVYTQEEIRRLEEEREAEGRKKQEKAKETESTGGRGAGRGAGRGRGQGRGRGRGRGRA